MIENARRIQGLRAEFGSFQGWLDAQHPLSLEEWTKLFKKTFVFTGGEIVKEFLRSSGYLPDAHDPDCPVYWQIAKLQPAWTRGLRNVCWVNTKIKISMSKHPTAEPFFFPGKGEKARIGCLVTHGFTGAPKEMRWMGEYLNRQGYTVCGIRLAGHATRLKDMVRSRWQDWLLSVEDGTTCCGPVRTIPSCSACRWAGYSP